MPLNTEIKRDGQTVRPEGGWQSWHVAAMVAAIAFERDDDMFGEFGPNDPDAYPDEPQGISVRNEIDFVNYPVIGMAFAYQTEYTLKQEHRFVSAGQGTGELHLMPGDILKAWRSST